jgi:hypothetical protein
MLEDANRKWAAGREGAAIPRTMPGRTVSIDKVPARHEAINDRAALKVLVHP